MKAIEEIDLKELKDVVKELNDSGLIKQKIKLVAISKENLIEKFTEAIDNLPEDADIPASIAEFYNEMYADEAVDDEDANEDADGDEGEVEDEDDDTSDEDEESDDDQDADDQDDDQDDSDGEDDDQDDDTSDEDEDSTDDDDSEPDDDQDDDDTPVKETKKKEVKKESKPKEIKEKKEPKEKKPELFVEKRAVVNPKLSLKEKVKNILNFGGGKYKQTAYFPLDCETIRVLETNVGLYPSEIFDMIKKDKKSAKKIEKYSDDVAMREINKIKSAYSYIVGAIKDSKTDSKFRHIMNNLVAGKEVPKEIAHPSTVKVARRALIAYLDVTGVDYSTLKDARKELVVAASKTEKAPKPAKEKEKKVEVKEEKKSSKKK